VSQSPVGARSSSPLSHDAAPASGDSASPATAGTAAAAAAAATTSTAVAAPVRQRRVLEPGDGEIFPFQVSGHDLMLRTRRGNVRIDSESHAVAEVRCADSTLSPAGADCESRHGARGSLLRARRRRHAVALAVHPQVLRRAGVPRCALQFSFCCPLFCNRFFLSLFALTRAATICGRLSNDRSKRSTSTSSTCRRGRSRC
jgi:hypothetical protein